MASNISLDDADLDSDVLVALAQANQADAQILPQGYHWEEQQTHAAYSRTSTLDSYGLVGSVAESSVSNHGRHALDTLASTVCATAAPSAPMPVSGIHGSPYPPGGSSCNLDSSPPPVWPAWGFSIPVSGAPVWPLAVDRMLSQDEPRDEMQPALLGAAMTTTATGHSAASQDTERAWSPRDRSSSSNKRTFEEADLPSSEPVVRKPKKERHPGLSSFKLHIQTPAPSRQSPADHIPACAWHSRQSRRYVCDERCTIDLLTRCLETATHPNGSAVASRTHYQICVEHCMGETRKDMCDLSCENLQRLNRNLKLARPCTNCQSLKKPSLLGSESGAERTDGSRAHPSVGAYTSIPACVADTSWRKASMCRWNSHFLRRNKESTRYHTCNGGECTAEEIVASYVQRAVADGGKIKRRTGTMPYYPTCVQHFMERRTDVCAAGPCANREHLNGLFGRSRQTTTSASRNSAKVS